MTTRAGDGINIPGGGHLDPWPHYECDRGKERLRRHGRVQLCGQQHLRRYSWVSDNISDMWREIPPVIMDIVNVNWNIGVQDQYKVSLDAYLSAVKAFGLPHASLILGWSQLIK